MSPSPSLTHLKLNRKCRRAEQTICSPRYFSGVGVPLNISRLSILPSPNSRDCLYSGRSSRTRATRRVLYIGSDTSYSRRPSLTARACPTTKKRQWSLRSSLDWLGTWLGTSNGTRNSETHPRASERASARALTAASLTRRHLFVRTRSSSAVSVDDRPGNPL